jgi:hypothetical protein
MYAIDGNLENRNNAKEKYIKALKINKIYGFKNLEFFFFVLI